MITFAVHANGLYDEVPVGEACRTLEEAGAAVVGVNCTRGPHSMLPLLKEIREACKVELIIMSILWYCFTLSWSDFV